MRNRIRRLAVLVIGIAGLLAMVAAPAYAGIHPNHCEPLLPRPAGQTGHA